MKIFIIRTSVSRGGADKITAWLYHKMKTTFSNDIVELVEFYDTASWENKDIKSIHLHQKTIKNTLLRNTLGFVKEYVLLYKLLKREKPDIVINFGCRLFYSIFLLRYVLNFKLLVSERMDPYTMKSIGDKFRRCLYQKSDLIVCQTERAAAFFTHANKKIVIPNPIINKLEKKWDISKTENFIVHIGRYDLKQKRQDLLLKAFANVVSHFPNYTLLLIGFGSDKNKIEDLSKQLGVFDKIVFMTTNDIEPFLIKSRVFAFSSDFEGIPNTVIEAMQIGIPVVSVDTSPGCINMLLQGGENGIITPLNDSNALAEGIKEMIESDEKSITYSEKAYKSLYRFEEIEIALQWENAIRKCID